MRDVAIIGVGLNKWGERWKSSIQELFVEASLIAIQDSGVDHIDSMYVGCMAGGSFSGQEHLASMLADYLGIAPVPVTRVESACASGGLAVKSGVLEVMSGVSDIVLVGGVEKMTDVSGGEATDVLATAADQEYESYQGVTFPGLYAMMAQAHMHKHGTTPEQLAAVAVKNHKHGQQNPMAQFPMKITVEDVLNSAMVADPLHMLDCSPITDGAAALILCPVEMARKLNKRPVVKISGFGHATDTIALHSRADFTCIQSTTRAATLAMKMANKKLSDIDLIELHDCFTIAELMVLESMGFYEPGKAAIATENGDTGIDGTLPVNPSGGLKSKGHPVGATGVGQLVEVTEQLWGNAGKRQIKKAKIGLTQNMGGTGGSSIVHILEVE